MPIGNYALDRCDHRDCPHTRCPPLVCSAVCVLPPPSTVFVFSPDSVVWPVRPLARGCTLANSAYTHTELAYQYANVNAHLIFSRPPLVPLVHAAFKSLGYSESDIRARVVMVTSQWLTGADAANLVRLEALSGHGAIESEVRFDGEQANEAL